MILTYQYVFWILRFWIQEWLISSMAYKQGELRLTPLSIDCHHQKGGDCWISDFDDEVNCHLLSNLYVEISVQGLTTMEVRHAVGVAPESRPWSRWGFESSIEVRTVIRGSTGTNLRSPGAC